MAAILCVQVADMEPELRKRGGLEPNVPLLLFEEVCVSEVRPLHDKTRQLGEVMDKLMDGNIIVFQPQAPPNVPDATRYFMDMFYRVDVLLCDKNDPLDTGFVVPLNRNWYYAQVSDQCIS